MTFDPTKDDLPEEAFRVLRALDMRHNPDRREPERERFLPEDWLEWCEAAGLIRHVRDEMAPGGLLVELTGVGRIALNRTSTPRPTKPTGRRKRGETPGEMKIIAALNTFLENDPRTPPTAKAISKAAGVGNVSRFLKEHWGGHQAFAAAWRRGTVAATLAKVQRYIPEGHAILPDE